MKDTIKMETLTVKTNNPEIKRNVNSEVFNSSKELQRSDNIAHFLKKLINEDGEEHQKVRTRDYWLAPAA